MCVCARAYVDDRGRGAKGGKVLPCQAQVQWRPPIPNNLLCTWTLKKPQKLYQLMKSRRKHFI